MKNLRISNMKNTEISMFDENCSFENSGQYKTISEIDKMIDKEIENENFIGSEYYTVIEPGLTHLKQDQTISHKELLENIQKYGSQQFATLPMMTFFDDEKLASN